MTKQKEALRIVGAGEALALLPVEDMEHLLDDVLGTLARIEAKRGRIQDDIAEASRGRRDPRGRRARAAAEGIAPGAPAAYTRKGAGVVRKRLRAAAGEAKKETERLEALQGELQEAIVDARARQRVALPGATA